MPRRELTGYTARGRVAPLSFPTSRDEERSDGARPHIWEGGSEP